MEDLKPPQAKTEYLLKLKKPPPFAVVIYWRLCHNFLKERKNGKMEKSCAYRVPMQLSLGMDTKIQI
jgi:ligand-binding SRPBCC domain-containing protein